MGQLFRGLHNNSVDVLVTSRASTGLTTANTWVNFRFMTPTARTLASVVVAIAQTQNTVAGIGRIRIETDDGTGKPSGILASGAVEESFTPSTAGVRQCQKITLANQPALSANTLYHIVLRNADGAPGSNNFSLSHTLVGTAAFPYAVQTTTTATWSSTYGSLMPAMHLIYTDGTEMSFGQLYADANPASVDVYGSGVSARLVRQRYRSNGRLKLSGLRIGATGAAAGLARTGTPSDLTVTLRDGSGTSLGSGIVPVACIAAGSTRNAIVFFDPPIMLAPNSEWRIEFSTSSGDNANKWAVGVVQNGYNLSLTRSQMSEILAAEVSTNGGSTWADISAGALNDAQFLIAPIVDQMGDFDGFGELALDTSTKDGGSGAALRLKGYRSDQEYTFRRFYYASTTGNKTLSVKMRRASTDIPTTLAVRLVKNGSTLATLTADASANDTFATYTSGAISLTAGDVVEIYYVVQKAAGNTNGYGWFDTESWT